MEVARDKISPTSLLDAVAPRASVERPTDGKSFRDVLEPRQARPAEAKKHSEDPEQGSRVEESSTVPVEDDQEISAEAVVEEQPAEEQVTEVTAEEETSEEPVVEETDEIATEAVVVAAAAPQAIEENEPVAEDEAAELAVVDETTSIAETSADNQANAVAQDSPDLLVAGAAEAQTTEVEVIAPESTAPATPAAEALPTEAVVQAPQTETPGDKSEKKRGGNPRGGKSGDEANVANAEAPKPSKEVKSTRSEGGPAAGKVPLPEEANSESPEPSADELSALTDVPKPEKPAAAMAPAQTPTPSAEAAAAPIEAAASPQAIETASTNSSQPTTTPSHAAALPKPPSHLLKAKAAKEEAARAGEIDPARFLSRVVKAFHSAQQRDGEVKLRLHPAELGSLAIEVKVQEGALTARLQAETPEAKAALMDNLPTLRERLAEQGIRIEKFDVDLMDHRDRQPQQSHEQTAREQAPRRAPSSPRITATATDNSSAPSRLSADGALNVVV